MSPTRVDGSGGTVSRRSARIRQMLLASAAGALLVLFRFSGEAIVRGGMVHMTAGEILIITLLFSLAMFSANTLILIGAAIAAEYHDILLAGIALPIFFVIASIIEPHFWSYILDIMDNGFGTWYFFGGILSVAVAYFLRRRTANSGDAILN